MPTSNINQNIIGLSGLLVKSAQMMVETAQDFRQAGVNCPMLVGGAALSNRFTRLRIAPEYDGLVAYAPDAMSGLALANTVMDADERQKLAEGIETETDDLLRSDQERKAQAIIEPVLEPSPAQVRHDFHIPNPPDLRLHVLRDFDLERIFPMINPQMLYGRHLGFKGRFAEALTAGHSDAQELLESVRKVEELVLASNQINANAVFKFFPCQADGQKLLVYSPDGQSVLEIFSLRPPVTARRVMPGRLCVTQGFHRRTGRHGLHRDVCHGCGTGGHRAVGAPEGRGPFPRLPYCSSTGPGGCGSVC